MSISAKIFYSKDGIDFQKLDIHTWKTAIKRYGKGIYISAYDYTLQCKILKSYKVDDNGFKQRYKNDQNYLYAYFTIEQNNIIDGRVTGNFKISYRYHENKGTFLGEPPKERK